MTRRESVLPTSPPEIGRRSLSTLPEIISLLDAEVSPRDAGRSPRSERVALVALNLSGVIGQVAADLRSSASAYRRVDDVPPTEAALVVVIADDASDRDDDGALRRLRARAPAAKFVFVAGRRDDERSRSLAAWGAVLPPSADAARIEGALRHASALSTMSAEMRRIKASGRLRPPPPESEDP